jgi:pathogenesis-related protein 1
MYLSITKILALMAALVSLVYGLTDDQRDALSVHNKARSAKKLKPLVWDNSLAASAKHCADKMAAAGKFLGHCQAGENAWWGWGDWGNELMTVASREWLGEKPNYHGERIPSGNFGAYGHYSKLYRC